MLNAIFFTPPIQENFINIQLTEIYKDQVYDKFVGGRKDLTIFDVGANIGITSYYFSQFAKQVHSFEPSKEHYEALETMITYNKLLNVTPHNYAITNTNGEAPFYHPQRNKTMYSLNPKFSEGGLPPETVKTLRLDTFIQENKIDHIDFMKLDVEGSEADIICADGFQNIASKIEILTLEVHSWLGRNPNQLKEGLELAGFKLDLVPAEAGIIVAKR